MIVQYTASFDVNLHSIRQLEGKYSLESTDPRESEIRPLLN